MKDSAILKMLPLSVKETLKASSDKSIARNTFIASVVGEALTLLRENDIEPVMLKGMALEYAWYGGRGFRQMTDADILVPREQALKARSLMLENGFSSPHLKIGISTNQSYCTQASICRRSSRTALWWRYTTISSAGAMRQ